MRLSCNESYEIDGKHVYFLKSGIQLRDSIREDENGNQYYDQTGAQFSTVTTLLMVKRRYFWCQGAL